MWFINFQAIFSSLYLVKMCGIRLVELPLDEHCSSIAHQEQVRTTSCDWSLWLLIGLLYNDRSGFIVRSHIHCAGSHDDNDILIASTKCKLRIPEIVWLNAKVHWLCLIHGAIDWNRIKSISFCFVVSAAVELSRPTLHLRQLFSIYRLAMGKMHLTLSDNDEKAADPLTNG